jgi:DNA-binding response OmpR family regulator
MGPLQITATPEQCCHYQHLDLNLDFVHKTALLDGEPLVLTHKEYELLAMLIQNTGDVVTRETLLLRLWGYSNQIRTRTLDVHIHRLRRKLGEYGGTCIETIFHVGYRFQAFQAQRA